MGLRTASTNSLSLETTNNNNSRIIARIPSSQDDIVVKIIGELEQEQSGSDGQKQQQQRQEEDIEKLNLSNVSVNTNMAPALTEPLSQTSKLSSSTTSASPRPTSNNLLINNNHAAENNNISTSNDHLESSKDKSLNGTRNNINKESSHKGTFQLAFERVIAKQAAAAAVARQKQLEIIGLSSDLSSNGSVLNHQMGPMCDRNTTNLTAGLNLDNNLAENQISQEDEEELKTSEVAEEIVELEDESFIDEERTGLQEEEEEVEHMDITSCSDDKNNSNQNDQIENVTSDQEDIETITISDTHVSLITSEANAKPSESEENNDKSTTFEESFVSNSSKNLEATTSQTNDPPPTIEEITEIQKQHLEEEQPEHIDVESEISSTNLRESIEKRSPLRKSPVVSSPQTPQQQQQQEQISQNQSQTTPGSSLTPQSTISGMGLQKDFIKDSTDMDQVLGDMDLLQVLKGFDTNPSGETLCDLAGSLVFFNDVDVMNYEEMGTPAKDLETKEIRLEIEKRQQQMQRKCDFLLRRLRKIQSRYMGKHASEEISGLFEWTNRVVRRKDHEHSRQISYEEDKHRTVSTASMRVLLKRIDAVANSQHSNETKKNKNSRLSTTSTGGGGIPPGPVITTVEQNKPTINSVVPQFDEKTTEEIGHVSGMLQTEIRQIQSSLDSDATASSSAGESADEMVTYNNQLQQPLSIANRATWRWARDRAGIAARWTWLLAQISDLEYRIRQHNELHHQIKKNKGAVTFEKIPSPLSACSSGNIESMSVGGDNLSGIGQTIPPSSVNGYRGILPGNTKPMDIDSVPPNGAYDSSPTSASGSCRTKPFQRAGFRKRKLLQTANVHTVSKKAARSSTVKCGCQWPLHPCALCTGRPDPTAPRDLPDTMPFAKKVALLDPGFHEVLSFPEDVSSSIHLEATLRSPEWQNRILRCSSKSILKGAVAAQKAAEREDRSKKYLDSRRKYNRKCTPQDIMAANKLKNAKNRRALHTGHGQINNHQHIKSKHQRKLLSSINAGGGINGGNGTGGAIGGGNINFTTGNGNGFTSGNAISTGNTFGNGGFSSGTGSSGLSDSTYGSYMNSDNFDGTNGFLPRSKNSSPTPGSHSYSSNFKSDRMDRRNRNSYDIDNIVIPYSVAAATRVEILPYKEIPTPKWRIIEDDDDSSLEIQKENEDDEKSPEITDNEKSENPSSEITPPEEATSSSNAKDQDVESEGVEDISDEAIQSRHERALLEERKKFQTFLKFPWSTRSRANRRVDSRAESSGANTPDPTSPAPNTPNTAGDQESIPSPAAPSTPQTPLETILEGSGDNIQINQSSSIITHLNNISNSAARRFERRRTVSLKKDRESSNKDEIRRSSSPDPREIVPPFEPLQFPLTDDLYEAMLQMMPNDHQIMEDCIKSNICDGNAIGGVLDKSNYLGGKGKGMTNDNGGGGGGGGSSIDITLSSNSTHMNNSLACDLAAFETEDSLLMGDESETDSADSAMQEEDPNDPEWREPA